jgi:hypothetical protein
MHIKRGVGLTRQLVARLNIHDAQKERSCGLSISKQNNFGVHLQQNSPSMYTSSCLLEPGQYRKKV